MRNIVYLFVAALVAGGVTAVGCGSDSGNNGGGGTNSTGGNNPGTGGTTGTNGTGGTPSTGTSTNTGGSTSTNGTGGGGGGLSCASYCNEVLGNCTADGLTQYPDFGSDGAHAMDVCLAVCNSFPEGMQSDMSGDTLGCRTYHGGAAAGDPNTHCWHAGPAGGDNNNTDMNAGACGDACEAFCNLEQSACGFSGANAQYTSMQNCMTACRALPQPPADEHYDAVGSAGTHDFFCYLYHLNAASVIPAVHCPHTKAGTSPCDPPATP
ncbi:MAG TPA: hypothetical protein VHB21_23160 [Minicystis sp.]|nr:hypothetical protein [Minicystis sp.]